MRHLLGWLAILAMASSPLRAIAAAASSETVRAPSAHSIQLALSPGLLLWNDNAGASLTLGASVRLIETLPLYAGFEVGYNYFSLDTTTARVRTNGIPLLATLFYQWEISRRSPFHPFAGVSGGVNFLATSLNGKSVPVIYLVHQGHQTSAELLLRAGLNIDVTPAVAVGTEFEWGVLASKLLVLPRVNLVVGI